MEVKVEDIAQIEAKRRSLNQQHVEYQHSTVDTLHHPEPIQEAVQTQPLPFSPFTRGAPKVGRNQPCPCGSGKKYKHCHGSLE